AAEIDAERAYLRESRKALQRMREHAQHLFSTGGAVAGDAYSAESLGRTLSRRVAELADDPGTPLFFGQLTFAEDATVPDLSAGAGTAETHDGVAIDAFGEAALADAVGRPGTAGRAHDHAGLRYHIGRRHVTDEAGEPLVLDWRAPISR